MTAELPKRILQFPALQEHLLLVPRNCEEIKLSRREARQTRLTLMAGLRSRLRVSPAWISFMAVTARQSRPETFHTEISALGEQEWPANLRVEV